MVICSFLYALDPVQQILPTPFCYFENLLLETNTATFLTSPSVDASKALRAHVGRPFSFQTRDPLPSQVTVIEGTTLFFFEPTICRVYLAHYFHLLEHVVGLWSFGAAMHAEDVSLIVLASDGQPDAWEKRWQGPNQINFHLLKALFPNAKVCTWQSLIQEQQDQTLLFQRAFTSDRALTFLEPDCTRINKMLGKVRMSISKERVALLAERLRAYAQVTCEPAVRCNPTPSGVGLGERSFGAGSAEGAQHPYRKKNPPSSEAGVLQSSELLRITFIKRPPPRTLAPFVEKQLLHCLSSLPHVSLQVADLAKMSFPEQIHTISNTDVLIGVHGNGLSHVLYLPPHAAVIEIFPPHSHALDYRLFSELRGVTHFSIIARGEHVLDSVQAFEMGFFGEFNRTIDELNFEPILTFLNHWINKFVKAG